MSVLFILGSLKIGSRSCSFVTGELCSEDTGFLSVFSRRLGTQGAA